MEEQINIIATNMNIDRDVVEKIVRSQFSFVKDTIEQGDAESVMLHHLGKWGVKPRYCKLPEI